MIKTVMTSLKLTDQARALTFICKNEGFNGHAYDDATGLRVKAPVGALTIGYGTNLESGLSIPEAQAIALNRLCEAEVMCLAAFKFFPQLSVIRKIVMLDLAYNLGMPKLQSFKTFLQLMAKGDFPHAADDLAETAWSGEVHQRAVLDVGMLRTNNWIGAIPE